ncbi:hypothetical protein PPL_01344 [Heterostelium album PN500]|uniref:Uncharacterized protein n=1 Tax=Heterostelium pallidum (strain ATCC 26659 / Pp 5 / PN500) TaxID=670386 RepID=D3AZ05_HETP5|nr:hypothetical protein PPL_01344 [Heterostelium album PN500]EFA85615.1 hypothetical protein PPL_01344 [Heterostelium album PN500]|eukprot:XP_020437722.1 hypothetical protein PPL_01344 [Heterostelium album PN500]
MNYNNNLLNQSFIENSNLFYNHVQTPQYRDSPLHSIRSPLAEITPIHSNSQRFLDLQRCASPSSIPNVYIDFNEPSQPRTSTTTTSTSTSSSSSSSSSTSYTNPDTSFRGNHQSNSLRSTVHPNQIKDILEKLTQITDKLSNLQNFMIGNSFRSNEKTIMKICKEKQRNSPGLIVQDKFIKKTIKKECNLVTIDDNDLTIQIKEINNGLGNRLRNINKNVKNAFASLTKEKQDLLLFDLDNVVLKLKEDGYEEKGKDSCIDILETDFQEVAKFVKAVIAKNISNYEITYIFQLLTKRSTREKDPKTNKKEIMNQ